MSRETLSDWLAAIGLAQYADLLERNAVDREVLPELREQDLTDLGIPLGHRKRLLKAIRDSDNVGATNAPEPPGEVARSPEETSNTSGERRQLTVLFCDLVGSTALSERLDPEELRALLHQYRSVCGEVIKRYEGFVARYIGDGILIYFGWPTAHEDDAERAIRAALDLVSSIQRLSAAEKLSVRIGIATGPVVVGEQAGEGDQSKLAIGSTPNLAARLQGLAAPNQIVIASSTRRLVGNAFELADLGDHELKGISEPVHVWGVQSTARVEGRFEASRVGAGLTPFVGREEELALLLARWKQAREGEGQIVLLCGEPGIGKSRITQTLRERLIDAPHTRLAYQCSPYHSNSAFYPVISQLERAAGFEREDTTDTKLDKLEALLALEPDQASTVAPLIAALLSLPIERYPPRMLSPQKQKELTMVALADQVIRLSTQLPVLMIVEDAHWIDPSTLEFLNLLPERVREAPVLMLLTHRPEFASPWIGQEHVTPINLNRLSRRLGSNLVEQVTGGKALPAEVLEQVLAKTDGVPLFVEELTKHILESGFLTETPDRYELRGPLPALAIPSSLQDSLMARLDRLGSTKEIAQIGACIGREFSHELLTAVSPHPPSSLERDLQRLHDSGLVLRRGMAPEILYTFKHAMVQDAAYESLLKSRRQEMHRRIASVIEEKFPALKEAEPGLLARHCGGAGLYEQALTYSKVAAERARDAYAYAETTQHYQNAVEYLYKLPEHPARDAKEIQLLAALGTVLLEAQGYGTPEQRKTFERLRILTDKVGDFEVRSLGALWWFDLLGANYPSCEKLLERMADLQDGREIASDSEVSVFDSRINTLFFIGNLDECRAWIEKANVVWAKAQRPAQMALQDWVHMAAIVPDFHSWSLLLLGYPDAASRERQRAVSIVQDHGSPFTHTSMLAHWLLEDYWRNSPGTIEPRAKEVIARSEEHGLLFRKAEGEMLLGWALAELGESTRGIALLESGFALCEQIGYRIATSFWMSLFTCAYRRAGLLEKAQRAAQRGLEFIQETGERVGEADLLRLQGELFLEGDGDAAHAEQTFVSAIHIAKRQSARLFELRASCSLARLWRSQGKVSEARELLTPIYDWFTEGFDTRDLKEAKALLDALN